MRKLERTFPLVKNIYNFTSSHDHDMPYIPINHYFLHPMENEIPMPCHDPHAWDRLGKVLTNKCGVRRFIGEILVI